MFSKKCNAMTKHGIIAKLHQYRQTLQTQRASLVKVGALWDRSSFLGMILNWTVCSHKSALIFWDWKNPLIPAVSVTRHLVCLQDGSIHAANSE